MIFHKEISIAQIKKEAKKILGPAIKAKRKLTKMEVMVLAILREKRLAHFRRLY